MADAGLLALLLYGLGQGFVKMWITEVPPARFCLYFAFARAVVMVCYFFANPHTAVFAADNRHVLAIGVLAYVLDGAGWIMYFQSIIAGPITIVGTLSAAYPALTIVFAHWFLGETLTPLQYGAVVLVIGGCIGLAYQPADAANKVTGRAGSRWRSRPSCCGVPPRRSSKYDYSLGATDANMALYSMIGALLTLGVYGVWKGRAGTHSVMEWTRSFLPMGMMASGDLGRADREPLRQDLDRDAADRRLPAGHARLRGARAARADHAAAVGLHRCDSDRYVLLHVTRCRRLNRIAGVESSSVRLPVTGVLHRDR